MGMETVESCREKAKELEKREIPYNKTDKCYRFANTENMEFFSPGYENENYSSSIDCEVILEAPSGCTIRLDFRDYFEIEPSAGCKNDYLEVREGQYGYDTPKGPPYCGRSFPPAILSDDRYLWVHFHSDENIEYKGFRAVYDFEPRPETPPEKMECKMSVSNEDQGFFGKQNISEEYIQFNKENNFPIDCLFNITVKEGWKVQLQFQKFLMEKPNEIESNFVEVFSGKTDEFSREKKFCGAIADSLHSKGNVMFVRFFTVYSEKTTFEVNFTAFREFTKGVPEEACTADEFDCEDNTCISRKLLCNKLINCRFRWDEEYCDTSSGQGLNDEHIIIIMVIFSLILTGMCFTFIYNCVKKIIRDHRTIQKEKSRRRGLLQDFQEHLRQSREYQLNELGKGVHPATEKRPSGGGKPRTRSPTAEEGGGAHAPCYVPGGDVLPILVRPERNSSGPPNGDAYPRDIYAVDVDDDEPPKMCDSSCQTRESLFTTNEYSSGGSSPIHSALADSPPAPFSTFGYNKRPPEGARCFRAEAKIEMHATAATLRASPAPKVDKRRQFSIETTKSAPDVIVTH